MLTGAEIGLLIAEPARCNERHLNDLQDLSVQYPYSPVFSILFLMALRSSMSIRFEEELIMHAYRITDRAQLYRLAASRVDQIVEKDEDDVIPAIEDERSVEVEVLSKTPEQLEADQPEELDFLLETEITQEKEFKFVSEHSSSEPEENEDALNQDELESSATEESETLTEQPINSIESEKTETSSEDDLIEENIRYNLMVSGYHLEELSERETLELEAKKVRSEENEPPVTETPEKNPTEKLTNFTAWLHANRSQEVAPIQQPDVSTLKVSEFKGFDPLEELSGSIEKPYQEFFSPAKKAKASLDESNMPISETLAKVFVLQGNFAKAIQLYEQLMLKFPEKKVFFANSIAQIKEKLKSIE